MSTKKQSKQPTKKQLIETCEELEKGVECVRGFLEKAEAEMKHLSSDGTLSTEGETCLGCRLQGYAEHNHACMKVIIKENDKLEEEIKEAEKKNKDLADFSEASVGGMFAIKKENEELKEENEKLKENQCEDCGFGNRVWSVLYDNDYCPTSYGEGVGCIKDIIKEHEKFKKEIDTMFDVTEYSVDMIEDGYTKLDAIYEWVHNRDGEIEDLKSQIPDNKGKKLSQKDKEALEEILHNIEHPEDHHNDGGGSFYEAKVNLLKRLMK